MGAVGGADFDQFGAGAAHDLGHAEGAADLDQFAARDDRLAPLGERIEHEQNRGGVVVDHGGVLGAGQFAQQIANEIVAVAAMAGAEIEFERNRVAHRHLRRLDRGFRPQRAAEIGVQHGAGEVEHRSQVRLLRDFEPRQRRRRDMVRAARRGAIGARRGQRLAHRGDDRGAAEPGRGVRRHGRAQHLVDRGQLAQRGGFGFRHCAPQ